jgi:hypothetical protein
MTAQTETAAWPEDVIARYLTVGGAVVDIAHDTDATVARCGGCGAYRAEEWRTYASRWDRSGNGGADAEARAWAQEHAEQCRAMPRPEGR